MTHPSALDPPPCGERAPLSPEAGRAAAISRHPAAGHPPSRLASFTDLVGLLTGPWRVDDPEGFAAAMTGATLLGGHAVLDLAEPGGFSPDPWSIRAWAVLRATLGGLAERRDLDVACVSGEHAGHRISEARGQAPAGRAEVECFVVAHVVEPLGGRGAGAPADHSWLVLVVGDGEGGVAVVARALLSCPSRPHCCRPPAGWSRPALRRLWGRLLVSEPPGGAETGSGVVLPFPRR